MDEFAQTRAPDDLFDDDFTPVIETPAQQQVPAPPTYESNNIPRGPHNQSRPSRESTQDDSDNHIAPPDAATPISGVTESAQTITSPTAPNTTPRTPRAHQAVRGDRLATGGTQKPKLTEDELSERLAAAKLNNAKRAEAHRLAEADEASFQQREARAQQRRQDESKARRVMDMEREKNRLRKLEAGARGGREWDEGKEDRAEEREQQGFRRGMNGGVAPRGSRGGRRGGGGGGGFVDEAQDDFESRRGGFEGRGRGRGRSERGKGGGRGGGRGGSRGAANAPNLMDQQPLDPAVDFPALPTPTKPSTTPSTGPIVDQVGESLKTADARIESWADQVEAKEA